MRKAWCRECRSDIGDPRLSGPELRALGRLHEEENAGHAVLVRLGDDGGQGLRPLEGFVIMRPGVAGPAPERRDPPRPPRPEPPRRDLVPALVARPR